MLGTIMMACVVTLMLIGVYGPFSAWDTDLWLTVVASSLLLGGIYGGMFKE